MSSATVTKRVNRVIVSAPGPQGAAGQDAEQKVLSGTGDPNGVVTASTPAIYLDITDPSDPVLWFKTSGTGNTGWV